jgi:hypothetical protein
MAEVLPFPEVRLVDGFYYDPDSDLVLEKPEHHADGRTTFSIFNREHRGEKITLSPEKLRKIVDIDRITASKLKRFRQIGLEPGREISSTRSMTRRRVLGLIRDERGVPTGIETIIIGTSSPGQETEFSLDKIITGEKHGAFEVIPTHNDIFRWANL